MFSKKLLITNLNRNVLKKYYHSNNVFGYKLKPSKKYQVSKEVLEARINNSNLYRLITAFRQHGHKRSNINPVVFESISHFDNELLDPVNYGLHENDQISVQSLLSGTDAEQFTRLSDVIAYLENAYCKNITAEFMHLESEKEIEWFASKMENASKQDIDVDTKKRILKEMLKSQTFDLFLASKFVSFKRYGGEGAESMLAFFSELFELAGRDTIEQIVLGMPHRGRLNLLTGMLEMHPAKLFRKLKGLPDFPTKFKCTGDVASHFISSVDLNINELRTVHLTMLYNPSHLEAVNPVSMGKTRSKQMTINEGDYGNHEGSFGDKILNVQVHGDAAYAGQGVNQECLALSKVPHFEIGGTLHLVVNNQLGFTTPADFGRSSSYCTDLAKMISAPIIHVNGDNPEAVVHATKIAFEYQRTFRRDVFIDMNCFRKWGHNELDDPTFTNPILYQVIQSKGTVPNTYAEKLKKENLVTVAEIENLVNTHNQWLSDCLKNAESYEPEDPCFKKQWSGFQQAPASVNTWDTGVHQDILTYVGIRSVSYPDDFKIHSHLQKTHVQSRLNKLVEGKNLDWATAEALAIGSLLYEGNNVRISGQDVGRGTFSHRHAILVDQKLNTTFIPLNDLNVDKQGKFEVANSILSEEAVLGYEYGMSIDNPNNLIIWEAQFGDFFNGAQIIIDTFVTCGEIKWLTCSGLVMLLPHGYDGAGPEHTSCKIERFLQLSDSSETKPDGDDVNIHVVNPTTPAQYFHLLRRQIIPNYRKPLIVVAPKILLRLSAAVSNLFEMLPGTHFQPVLDDTVVGDPLQVKKIIFVSGKHYYALSQEREARQLRDVAIIRLESLCPFPTHHLQVILEKYTNANNFVWSQEEHRNMGAWSFVKPRFENLIGLKLRYCGREIAATPAVGVASLHQDEANDVVKKSFL